MTQGHSNDSMIFIEQLQHMRDYLEKVFGDRALVGDKNYRDYLIKDCQILEAMIVGR